MREARPGAGRLEPEPPPSLLQRVIRPLLVILLLYLFLVAINGLGTGFKMLSRDLLDSFFTATENPFIALMIGVLATTLVQSSSVSTALIVGLVAAPENPLPVANAIPMIMGTNIGTTVTNTLASLAHMGRREEFRRAFAVATCHDFFNYFTVALLLPIELWTGFLGKSAAALASLLGGFGGAQYESPIGGAIKAGSEPLQALLPLLGLSKGGGALFFIIMNAVLIVVTLLSIVAIMRRAMHSRVEAMVTRALDNRAFVGMVLGMVATVMVQSSSITTSLLVPLAGAGILTLPNAFPITLGANVGTTVTALLAAMAATDVNAGAGLTIALVHLLFNVTGILIFYPVRALRQLPLGAARKLAEVAVRSRSVAILYVVLLFYVVPALFAIFNRLFSS